MSSVEIGRWYVLYSKRRHEEIAQFYLQRKGLDVFFPRLLLPQSAPNRLRIVPLFPNYLFVRIQNCAEYDFVRWSPGVTRVVDADGRPLPLANEVVEFLRRQATPAGIITMSPSLTARQDVEHMSERTARLMNVLLHPQDSKERVKVLMQFLSR